MISFFGRPAVYLSTGVCGLSAALWGFFCFVGSTESTNIRRAPEKPLWSSCFLCRRCHSIFCNQRLILFQFCDELAQKEARSIFCIHQMANEYMCVVTACTRFDYLSVNQFYSLSAVGDAFPKILAPTWPSVFAQQATSSSPRHAK